MLERLQTLRIPAEHADSPGLDQAADTLRRGGLVAFPTETVYGLGGNGLDEKALHRIFEAKNRPLADPLILHVTGVQQARTLAREWPAAAERLCRELWPGPLTLLLPRAACVPDAATAGLDSVALRAPAHPIAAGLLRRVAFPVAAPSANLFSRPSPTTADHVLHDLAGRIEAVLDGGPCPVGIESTVLDLRDGRAVIRRPGGVPREAIEAILGYNVPLGLMNESGPALPSPGLLERHYSPSTPLILVEGWGESALRELARRLAEKGRFGLVAPESTVKTLRGLCEAVESLGALDHPSIAAARLYSAIRRLDALGLDAMFSHTYPPGGFGDSINDRLLKAAGSVLIRTRF